jgi:hypothetical protein
MRLIHALPLIAGFAFAACGDNAPDEPKTVEQVAKEAARIEGPQPGLYRSSVKLVSYDMPGAPPQMADMMNQRMNGLNSKPTEYCLTPEEAKGGFEEMLRKGQQGKCTFQKFEAGTNTIDASMTCETGPGVTSTVAMKGTISATASKLDMEMAQNNPGVPGGRISMKMHVENERIGDCPPA